MFLVRNPQIPGGILGDTMDRPTWNATYSNKPLILQVAEAANRREPNSPARILKKGNRNIAMEFPLSLAHARNLPVRPSLSEDAPFEMEARIRGKDGEDRWFFDPIQSATRPQPGETAF